MREVKLLSELDHPHVVQYVESFTESGCVFMVGSQTHSQRLIVQVMEFCEAGDLFTLITKQRGKPLQEELILFFFLQVVSNPSRGLS